VEDSLFQVFGVKPLLGRTSQPGDAHGSCNSLVLSYEAWRRHFSSNPSILGEKITIDGREARVIGVLPQGFWFPSKDVGVWWLGDRTSFSGDSVGVVARLRPQLTDRWVEWALQRDIANSTLIALSSNGQVAVNQWLNPFNGVSYPLQVQTPQYRIDSFDALRRTREILLAAPRSQSLC